jgi:hypothetical protein
MRRIPILSFVVLGALCGCANEQNNRVAAQVIAAQRGQAGQPTPATAIAAAAPRPVKPAAEKPGWYAGLPQTHWVTGVRERGARVQLEDNSVWAIPAEYQPVTQVWLIGQKITVTEIPGGAHPYRLANAERDATVEAALVAGP